MSDMARGKRLTSNKKGFGDDQRQIGNRSVNYSQKGSKSASAPKDARSKGK